MPSLSEIFASMRGMEPEQTPQDAGVQAGILEQAARRVFSPPVQYAAPHMSENVDNRIAEGSPYFPSQRAKNLLDDLGGPTSLDPERRAFFAKDVPEWMQEEITGFNLPRIYPGLSTDPRDVALRQGVANALSGNELGPTPPYTGWPQQR